MKYSIDLFKEALISIEGNLLSKSLIVIIIIFVVLFVINILKDIRLQKRLVNKPFLVFITSTIISSIRTKAPEEEEDYCNNYYYPQPVGAISFLISIVRISGISRIIHNIHSFLIYYIYIRKK